MSGGPIERALAAYGQPFDAPFPTQGGELRLAAVDTSAWGHAEAPVGATGWTVVVDISAWPDDLVPDRQIEGPPVGLFVEAGQAAMPGPQQRILVPALGCAVPTHGAACRATLVALPQPSAVGAIRGTLQLRRGRPRQFVETQTVALLPATSRTIELPPFAASWKASPNAAIASLSYSFNPRNGGKALSILSNTSPQILGNYLPIPRGAASVDVINGDVNTHAISFAFEGQI